MGEGRYRVLFVASHPTQYMAPLFGLMAQHPLLEPVVAYCSLRGAEAGLDPEFGQSVAWDIPLLEGYRWVHMPNRSPVVRLGGFFGRVNPGMWKLLREGGFDAAVIYTGYRNATFWLAAAAAKTNGVALLFGTDAHELRARDNRSWKLQFKRWFWPRLFRLADVVIVPSSGSANLIRSLGISDERIVLTPYVVNNNWWIEQAARVDRAQVRREWGVPESSRVVLFCAKLQPWKRPLDLLQAFAQASVPDAHLVYAGDGPERSRVKAEAAALGITDRVRILGFVNQSKLPATYCAADLLALPSEYEPFGVVVNEAMLCGCPVVVSDRVGAAPDLVRPGQNGFVFPCGHIDALATILRQLLPDRVRLAEVSAAARRRMETWSPKENIAALVAAVEQAVGTKCRR